jgi:hypothetical protein
MADGPQIIETKDSLMIPSSQKEEFIEQMKTGKPTVVVKKPSRALPEENWEVIEGERPQGRFDKSNVGGGAAYESGSDSSEDSDDSSSADLGRKRRRRHDTDSEDADQEDEITKKKRLAKRNKAQTKELKKAMAMSEEEESGEEDSDSESEANVRRRDETKSEDERERKRLESKGLLTAQEMKKLTNQGDKLN